MSNYTQRDFSGSLFRNDKKTSDNHPNAKGKAMVNGVMYWLSAWTKTTANGEKWQSLSFTPIDGEAQAKLSEPPPVADDDLPF